MARFLPAADLAALIERVRLLAAGHETKGFVVGGTVRDVLMGRISRDLDIAIGGDALAFARSLAREYGGHFVALDEERATARVVLAEGPLFYIDVTRLHGSIEQDLKRRDYTVDALAVPLGSTEVIDVTGGLDDLRARTVRMTSAAVLTADPVRPLRGARIAAELGFAIETDTAREIRRLARDVSEASPERCRDELARIFALERAAVGVRLLDGLGLLDALLPELAAGRGCTQPAEFHVFDVFEHNVRTLEAMDAMLAPHRPEGGSEWMRDALWGALARWEPELRQFLAEELTPGVARGALLKIAALLHDVGKPETRSVESDGRIRFLDHGDVGARRAASIMRRLRFATREIALVKLLVAEHLRPVQLAPLGALPTRRALYRFHRVAGDALPLVLLLALADGAAARGDQVSRDGWSRQAAYMNGLLVRLSEEEGIVRAPRLLTGHDIMEQFGIGEGPQVGRLLEELREAQATGDVTDRDSALTFVRARIAT